ncbi:hypothetical protein F5050DRAFT_1806630 [Lentinula boryana]|uniref:Zn(2)-C6 fungal-type domain-containing protein n=1 Tax=Lentinula boryana TaxID=40481 RepID=A0ABQ8QGT7_9AGAR|nr:hypothetical protein F5050DRAFT_1806630 [Lentinula boryana]
MNNNAKASSSKRRSNDDGEDERRRPRKGMDDRRRERLARLRQKVRTRSAIVRKEKGKEQRDEEVDEEHPNELPPTEEPPMLLASCSDFPSDHWVEPNKEALDLSPMYPDNCVSVMVPPLPPSSPPADGPIVGALRIPRCANCKIGARVGQPCIVQNARNRCTSCAKRRIKCADDETLAARNARLVKGAKVGKRRGKEVEEIEEDDEDDEDERDVSRVPRMGLRERYPRGAQSLEDRLLIKTRRIGEQQEMTMRVMDRMEERQGRIENKLARIARLLEARENEANEGSEDEESEEKDEGNVEE